MNNKNNQEINTFNIVAPESPNIEILRTSLRMIEKVLVALDKEQNRSITLHLNNPLTVEGNLTIGK